MKSAILLIRPQQWVKNFFVFLPLFFDRHLLDAGYLVPAVVVFLHSVLWQVPFIVSMMYGMLNSTGCIRRNASVRLLPAKYLRQLPIL